MTEVTLDRLDERTKSHGRALDELKAEVRAEIAALKLETKYFWRIIFWGGGACMGFGALGVLLVPRVIAAIGL
jgi:hypothetical protein